MDTKTLNLNINFSAGVDSAYAELPVDAAYLRWTRGNTQLAALKDADPQQYWGGWSAKTKNREGEPLPYLPLGVFDRMTKDGRKTYQVYASNVIQFLPLAHRTRFEKRDKVIDPITGEERTKVVAVSKGKAPGFQPHKQVFGLVFGPDGTYAPAVLVLDKWSSFINFQRAEGKFAKVKAAPGLALVRKYGTVGKDGKPNMETVGQSLSTPIEAIDPTNARTIQVTDDIAKLYYDAQEWADCPKWNASGDRSQEEDDLSAKSKFLRRAEELNLSNIDIEQLLAENSGDYLAAFKSISGDGPESEDDFPF